MRNVRALLVLIALLAVVVSGLLLVDRSSRDQDTLSPSKEGNARLPIPVPPDTQRGDRRSLAVDIFFDGTSSMQGFVSPSGPNSYKNVVRLLEPTAISSWQNGIVNLFKFGSTIVSLDHEQALAVVQREFYQESAVLRETLIQDVIDTSLPEHLTIIVTDLFQHQADFAILVQRLLGKYIRRGYAIGTYGIRSSFTGTVFDIGSDNDAFPYECADAAPHLWRPFYLFILGSHDDVLHFYERLYASTNDLPESHFCIFTPHIVQRPATFGSSTIDSLDGLVNMDVSQRFGPHAESMRQFALRDATAPPCFVSTMDYRLLQHAPEFSLSKLRHDVTGYVATGETWDSLREAEAALHLEPISLSYSELMLRFTVRRDVFREKGTYCFRAVIRPEPDSFSLPDWIRAWDMNLNDLDSWRTGVVPFDGSRTYNLRLFMEFLWDSYTQSHELPIAHVVFAIEMM